MAADADGVMMQNGKIMMKDGKPIGPMQSDMTNVRRHQNDDGWNDDDEGWNKG